jgi:AAA family ATP:ADP antiporter
LALRDERVLLAAEWALGAVSAGALAVIIYLHWAVFGGTVVSTFWSVINERFDPRAGKRYVGWIAAGGTAGGILGGIAAFGSARLIETHDTLLALSGMHVFCAILSYRHLRSRAGAKRSAQEPGSIVPSALGVLSQVEYLRNLALLVATVSAMEALADYALNAQAAVRWARGPELLSFFSLFHMMVSVITFLLQILAGRLALERLGIVGAMAMLPLVAIPGAGVAALVPHLWSAVALRGAMAAVGNSLYRSGYELLFGPLPPEKESVPPRRSSKSRSIVWGRRSAAVLPFR